VSRLKCWVLRGVEEENSEIGQTNLFIYFIIGHVLGMLRVVCVKPVTHGSVLTVDIVGLCVMGLRD